MLVSRQVHCALCKGPIAFNICQQIGALCKGPIAFNICLMYGAHVFSLVKHEQNKRVWDRKHACFIGLITWAQITDNQKCRIPHVVNYRIYGYEQFPMGSWIQSIRVGQGSLVCDKVSSTCGKFSSECDKIMTCGKFSSICGKFRSTCAKFCSMWDKFSSICGEICLVFGASLIQHLESSARCVAGLAEHVTSQHNASVT